MICLCIIYAELPSVFVFVFVFESVCILVGIGPCLFEFMRRIMQPIDALHQTFNQKIIENFAFRHNHTNIYNRVHFTFFFCFFFFFVSFLIYSRVLYINRKFSENRWLFFVFMRRILELIFRDIHRMAKYHRNLCHFFLVTRLVSNLSTFGLVFVYLFFSSFVQFCSCFGAVCDISFEMRSCVLQYNLNYQGLCNTDDTCVGAFTSYSIFSISLFHLICSLCFYASHSHPGLSCTLHLTTIYAWTVNLKLCAQVYIVPSALYE